MAAIDTPQQTLEVVTISKEEAANIIALLAGQLADTHIQGVQSGAAPELRVVDRGQLVKRLVFVIDKAAECKNKAVK